jgi:hypothetical protein
MSSATAPAAYPATALTYHPPNHNFSTNHYDINSTNILPAQFLNSSSLNNFNSMNAIPVHMNNSSSATPIVTTDPSLKRKKRARHPELWKRNNYQRKQLKDKGACKCTRKCFERVSEMDRFRIKNEFGGLNKKKQDEYLLDLITISQKKSNKEKCINSAENLIINEMEESNDNASDSESDNNSEISAKKEAGLGSSVRSFGRAPKLFNSKYFVRVAIAHNGTVSYYKHRVCHFAFLSMHYIGKKRVNNLVAHAFNNCQAIASAIPSNSTRETTNSNNMFSSASNNSAFLPNPALHSSLLNLAQPISAANLLHSSGSTSHPNLVTLAHQIPPKSDLRGRHSTRVNRIAEELIQLATNHIHSFPRYTAYNTLNHPNTDIKPSDLSYYLSSQLTLVKMYRLFINQFQPILIQLEKFPQAHKLIKNSTLMAQNNSSAAPSTPNSSVLPSNSTNFSPSPALSISPSSELLDFSLLEAVFPLVSCNFCRRSCAESVPVFWNSSAYSVKSNNSTASAGQIHEAFPLLGLFCSTNCVNNFSHHFIGKLQQNLGQSSAMNAQNCLSTPYLSWKEMLLTISRANYEKLLKPLISRDKYERLFRSLNLKFGSGRPENCLLCSELTNKLESNVYEARENQFAIEEKLHLHLNRSKQGQEIIEHDKKLCISSWQKYYQTHAAKNIHNLSNFYQNSTESLNSVSSLAHFDPNNAFSASVDIEFAPSTVETLMCGYQSNRPCPQFIAPSSSANSKESHNSINSAADSLYYKRQLHVYSFGIYSLSNNSAYNYLYDERTGKKKCNELLSLIYSHLIQQRIATKLRSPWLILLGDNSFHNFYSVAFFAELTRENSPFHSYRRIDYKCMESGHNGTEIDKILAGIERESKLAPIYKPTDWLEAVRNLAAKKQNLLSKERENKENKENLPNNHGNLNNNSFSSKNSRLFARWLSRDQLYDWKSYLHQYYSKEYCTVDLVTGTSVDLTKCVWFNFGVGKDNTLAVDPLTGQTINSNQGNLVYHPNEIWVKYSLLDKEPWKKVRITNYEQHLHSNPNAPIVNNDNNILQPLYKELQGRNLGISYKKAKDLFEARNFILPQYHAYYPPPGDLDKEIELPSDSSSNASKLSQGVDVDIEFELDDSFPIAIKANNPIEQENQVNSSLANILHSTAPSKSDLPIYSNTSSNLSNFVTSSNNDSNNSFFPDILSNHFTLTSTNNSPVLSPAFESSKNFHFNFASLPSAANNTTSFINSSSTGAMSSSMLDSFQFQFPTALRRPSTANSSSFNNFSRFNNVAATTLAFN